MRILLLFFVSFFAGMHAHMPLAEANQPSLRGSWELTFCGNPDKSCDLTYCFTFTRVAGTVSEMPRSGTWALDPYIHTGQWVQHGDVVQFFAGYAVNRAYISFTGILNGSERLGGISYVDALVDGTEVYAGTWFAHRVKTCPRITPTKSRSGLISVPQ